MKKELDLINTHRSNNHSQYAVKCHTFNEDTRICSQTGYYPSSKTTTPASHSGFGTKKHTRRKRRKFAKTFFLSCCVFFLLFLCLFYNSNSFTIRNLFTNFPAAHSLFSNPYANYEITKPQQLDHSQMEKRLLQLSKNYPEFQSIYDHQTDYPDNLLSALCNNPEMIDYVKGYLNADTQSASGGFTVQELSADFPLLIQWDQRWGYVHYGDNNIGLSGCAPTCLSMVIAALTHNSDATPDKVAAYAETEGYYAAGTGTRWSLMTEGCESFGIHGSELPLNKSTVFSNLDAGQPIICSLRAGDFTTQGHFIVLVGTQDGKIRVNDPNSYTRSSQLWDYDTLEGQIKNLWSFTANP